MHPMPNDYVPRPSGSNTGWIVAIVLLIALVPLVLCGLGLGVGWFYTSVEVQPPPVVEVERPAVPPQEPRVEEPPGDTEPQIE
jgi:hypothetical protein